MMTTFGAKRRNHGDSAPLGVSNASVENFVAVAISISLSKISSLEIPRDGKSCV